MATTVTKAGNGTKRMLNGKKIWLMETDWTPEVNEQEQPPQQQHHPRNVILCCCSFSSSSGCLLERGGGGGRKGTQNQRFYFSRELCKHSLRSLCEQAKKVRNLKVPVTCQVTSSWWMVEKSRSDQTHKHRPINFCTLNPHESSWSAHTVSWRLNSRWILFCWTGGLVNSGDTVSPFVRSLVQDLPHSIRSSFFCLFVGWLVGWSVQKGRRSRSRRSKKKRTFGNGWMDWFPPRLVIPKANSTNEDEERQGKDEGESKEQ